MKNQLNTSSSDYETAVGLTRGNTIIGSLGTVVVVVMCAMARPLWDENDCTRCGCGCLSMTMTMEGQK